MLAPVASLVRRLAGGHRASAIIETALVVPLLLTIAFGIVGIGRVLQARLAVEAVAREAATSAAAANNAAQAQAHGLSRGRDVAAGYGLTNGSFRLTVDPGTFARGGQVMASAQYRVDLADLPLLQWTTVTLRSGHAEPIDLYRSRWPASAAP